jgi:hypothetical protein
MKDSFDPGEIEEIRKIKNYRIEAQYSIKTSFQKSMADEALVFARRFLSKVEHIRISENVIQKVQSLRRSAKTQERKS